MWDRSGDRRGNSVAVYAIQSETPLTFGDLCQMFARDFPRMWRRINDASPVYPAPAKNGEPK
jgi:hypothetical protein